MVLGFWFGFDLFNCRYFPSDPPPNLTSSSTFPSIVDKKLAKEASLGRISGPYSYPPLDNMVFSPLGLQPKKIPGEFRVIHHLSYPRGRSINDGIPKDCASVHYASIGQAIQSIVSLGRGCFLAKTDIKSAFRIVPVHPSNYHLLGFKWRDGFYYDCCLPMGCSSSCAIFEAISTSLEWIIRQKLTNVAVLHVLDDFLFVAETYKECLFALKTFEYICQDIGVPLAPEKTEGPSQALPFVGIYLDCIDMSASLPVEKITKFMDCLDSLISKKSATLKQIQSLTGMLNFACGVISPARAFSRRLYDLEIGLSKPYHHAKISKSVKEDLLVWRNFLKNFNRKSFFLDYKFLSQHVLRFFTDASSTIGYGGYFGSHWFSGCWSEQCLRLNIALLEIFPIYIALKLWGPCLSNRCIMLMSDNMAVVHILNKFTSKEPLIMSIVRLIVHLCMVHNILIRSTHVLGKNNCIADMLSRSQEEEMLKKFPHMDARPTIFPHEWELQNLVKL